MAEILGQTTCRIHVDRSATARCPSCGDYFCSECITEHDGKLTCASCLDAGREQKEESSAKRRLRPMPVFHLVVAISVVWVIFYLFAQFLADLPDDFHDGTLWE